ncbi:MAG: CoA transferase [Acidimicrobiaceae bacterium]|nr:CoA transferase [Acidimicrobiaceae bacterium]MYD07695.1 CoA transferase [Acidimicrobiaceae bacterium]MYI59782.1 CoA transferase [Acidimicrobiaceae bacterium]
MAGKRSHNARDVVPATALRETPTVIENPLSEFTVLDVTDRRGALCGRLLADLGANVIRLNNSDGDSATDRFRNHGKSRAEAGQGLAELLPLADVFIENGGPGSYLDRPGLEAEYPQLVIVSLTDLGLSGPRSHWHLEALPAQAGCGALHATGHPSQFPTALPGYLAHDCASVHGAMAAVAALMDRRRTGLGQQIETSAQEAGLGGTYPWGVAIPGYLSVNPVLPVEGKRNAEGFYLVVPCRDGHVRMVFGSEADWQAFFELCGKPEEVSGPEWLNRVHRAMNPDAIREVAERGFADYDRAELFAESLRLGLPLGSIQHPLEFVNHPQTTERGFFVDGVASRLWRFHPPPTETPSVDASATPAAGARSSAKNDGLLLDGVRVIEFGIAAVVPELCWMLSELGADVIKIESRKKPDVLRAAGLEDLDRSFCFNMECRGRRGVALDLSSADGRRLARELCASADVVAENNRGGVMAKLGLDYPDIAAVNPNVVYVASQGYGRGGPMGEMKAFGPLNSSFAGIHMLWSHPDGPYPCGTSLNHPDHIASKMLTVAVLCAIDHRNQTGEGSFVEMAQTEAAAYLLGELYLEAIETGVNPTNLANRDPHMAPQGVYPGSEDDSWVAITVQNDDAWRALEVAAGWMPDESLSGVEARFAAHDSIDERLSQWTSLRSPEQTAELLQAAGVSAMPVMGPLDHLADPHLSERGLMVDLVHKVHGPEQQPANPTRMSRTVLRTADSAPPLGFHTHEVLREVLGLDDDELDRLESAGVFY